MSGPGEEPRPVDATGPVETVAAPLCQFHLRHLFLAMFAMGAITGPAVAYGL